MAQHKEKIVGIIGGMGPEATCDFMMRIIKNTPAKGDGDHIRCLVDNNPKVPSRVGAIFENSGEAPGTAMVEMAKGLERLGADFLAIPCNTAHYYYPEVQKAVAIPVLNMLELTVAAALAANPALKKVGVLCTPATRMTGLYGNLLASKGIEAVYPGPELEMELLGIIRAVKGGDTSRAVKDRFLAVQKHIADNGAEIAFIACTELSVIHEPGGMPALDASEVLARAAVELAKGA